jgi:hypothetical protein
MNPSVADRLLARLNEGDPAAAAEVLQSFEPYLRMVVRRKISCELRAKFDSTERPSAPTSSKGSVARTGDSRTSTSCGRSW